ncbi:MAG: KH domain-containing protein [Candidatus Pacebacteria bacterium]|jgi:predicted RNA-binding protein YlqC (UPF0109 family)|nr:KH domain-containing protein [Candidatus Paceibacterota bacterium]MDD2796442.1 KH domain-containing protein [Candidatus Paceibacterota bacterium]MDD3047828.1 KH domain-containing protein [Candidatus Paceibacterota bacterium]MDD3509686.1 KH domain-containing protein [Candidatus Paceibacterota bacterium]MDD3918614.1 KH domain-containing protein [Candidatus Paceibacterota bacterium]
MAEVKDQDFLEFIVKTLVDHPDDVIINRDVDEMGVLLTVKVNPEDMGQLIGRQGSTARAIRSLVKIIGLKNHARVNLKIEEPEGSTKVREEKKEEKIEDVTDGLDDLKI